MSLAKFESDVKVIPQAQETVYARFSDLNNLTSLKERLGSQDVRKAISEQMPDDRMEDISSYVKNMSFDTDTLRISSPVGEVSLCVVERDAPKCIKFASEGFPVPLFAWVQLLPHGDEECKMRVTVGAEVSFFMKGMLAKPLQQAADTLAALLAAVR